MRKAFMRNGVSQGVIGTLRELLEKTNDPKVLSRMYAEACRRVEHFERSGDVAGLVDAKYEKQAIGRRLGDVRYEVAYGRIRSNNDLVELYGMISDVRHRSIGCRPGDLYRLRSEEEAIKRRISEVSAKGRLAHQENWEPIRRSPPSYPDTDRIPSIKSPHSTEHRPPWWATKAMWKEWTKK